MQEIIFGEYMCSNKNKDNFVVDYIENAVTSIKQISNWKSCFFIYSTARKPQRKFRSSKSTSRLSLKSYNAFLRSVKAWSQLRAFRSILLYRKQNKGQKTLKDTNVCNWIGQKVHKLSRFWSKSLKTAWKQLAWQIR